MEKSRFNELPLKAKLEHYRREYESVGVLSGFIGNSYKKNISTREISTKIRVKLEELLVDKNIINSRVDFKLEDLHAYIPESMKTYNFNSGVNVISQKFYETDIEFRNLYLEFIKGLYNNFFHFPFYFQKTPTIRLHCPDAIKSNHYPRYHSDVGYGHPPQEINLWIPLTHPVEKQKHGFRVMDLDSTRKILDGYNYNFESFINDAIKSKIFNQEMNKYSPQVDTVFGESFIFDSRCLHSAEPLKRHTRVSIDIRFISIADYQRDKYLYQGQGKLKSLYEPGQAYDILSSDIL